MSWSTGCGYSRVQVGSGRVEFGLREHFAFFVLRRGTWRSVVPDLDEEVHRARSRAWYAANPERGRARARRWAEDNPERVIANGSAWRQTHKTQHRETAMRTRRRNQVLSTCEHADCWSEGVIELSWRANDHKCYLCGVALDLNAKRRMPGCVEFDHVVPVTRGGLHCVENVRPSCAPCNMSKGSMTADEFMALRSEVASAIVRALPGEDLSPVAIASRVVLNLRAIGLTITKNRK